MTEMTIRLLKMTVNVLPANSLNLEKFGRNT